MIDITKKSIQNVIHETERHVSLFPADGFINHSVSKKHDGKELKNGAPNVLSCHPIISYLITETTSSPHSNSAGIIRLDHSDWPFLVFWDFLFYGAHIR